MTDVHWLRSIEDVHTGVIVSYYHLEIISHLLCELSNLIGPRTSRVGCSTRSDETQRDGSLSCTRCCPLPVIYDIYHQRDSVRIMNQSTATPPASEPSSQNRRHVTGTVTHTWTRHTVQTRSHRTVTHTKMTVHATETKTVSEKTRKVDSDITQTITGPFIKFIDFISAIK
ncbi:hypothetical protein EV424DRAFT_1354476 [Suillus variegatus]|nr:hypothetical protein EV424DRAFT_1354476 [Suillus variegatus]